VWWPDAPCCVCGRGSSTLTLGCHDAGSVSIAIWFGIFYLIFYLFDTVANVPYVRVLWCFLFSFSACAVYRVHPTP